ncbi:MAG: helix-turn-helix transcriptional regulator [Lactobacillus johnsonii]|uniref:helix-turn-helix transcriptional regulator n=1 Tax=uncultured Lactobacillus sp. TaxID=153152 RepID=UPI0024306702|nr:helix-turn-helix transcriptional regulator [uncultured Lactobacillus sp.]MCI6761275.1 helix-turn-helix transcriptional regulator [Lactobacillus johnsonii]
MPKITAKAARVNADLTLKEAAKKLGLSYQTLSSLENDEDKITLGLAKKMSKIYQIPMDFIFK